MKNHRWHMGIRMLAGCALGWGVARAAEPPTNAPPALPPAAAEQGTDDFQFILDRIREIEKSHVQNEIELERLRARKAELEAQLEERKRRVQELERRQAELQAQARAQESAPARDPSGWYTTMAPVDARPMSAMLAQKKLPSGQYLRVTGPSASGAWRVRLEGAEYEVTPAENLIEDSVLRARLDARRAEYAGKGDTARAEQITRVLEHLRELLREAAAAQVVPESNPPPPPAGAESAGKSGKN